MTATRMSPLAPRGADQAGSETAPASEVVRKRRREVVGTFMVRGIRTRRGCLALGRESNRFADGSQEGFSSTATAEQGTIDGDILTPIPATVEAGFNDGGERAFTEL